MDASIAAVWWAFVGFTGGDLDGRVTVKLEKEDEHWTYLRLSGKERIWFFPDPDFQVVLAREGRWVRRFVWWPSRNETWTVDFKEPRKESLPPRTWEPPFKELPVGWKADTPSETPIAPRVKRAP